jgi:CRISPR-associated protein Csb2
MKTVRALHLPDEGSVFYLWPLTPESLPQRDSLFAALDRAARGIVALGWGQNLVMAHLRVLEESDLANLPGDRWVPGRGREWLRLPIPGTLDRLIHRREVFLKRVQGNRYEHISDLDTQGYRVVAYHREAEPEPLPTVGFALRQPQGDKRVSFAPTNWTMRVAGMLRHALSEAAQRTGRPKDWIARYILGHEPQGGVLRGGLETRRFGYVPLPSLLAYGNTRRIGPIQRVLLTAPPGDEAEIAWASQLLAGQTLLYRHLDEGTTTELAVLSPTSAADCFALNAYQGRSRIWSSVTPVVLPGRDDGKPAKTERLIRRCLEHAGLPTQARIHWQLTGYHRGVEWAKRYQLPMSQQTPVRYHVRIEFEEPLAGPIVLGAGRYFGGGLMIANLDKEGMQE